MRNRVVAVLGVVAVVTLAACTPRTGTLSVVGGTSVGVPPGYVMAVVSTTGGHVWSASEGVIRDGRSGGALAGSAKPGTYQITVAYFACDQPCLASAESPSAIPSRARAAAVHCEVEVEVKRGKTTQITAAYSNGTASCAPARPR